jgi:hypothetical protein
MPITPGQLLGESSSFDWTVKGETLHVTFNPNAYTPALEGELEKISETDFQAKGLVQVLVGTEELSGLLIDLDGIANEDGSKYEPTAENLAKLPVQFLNELVQQIQEHTRPSSEEGNS